MSNTEDNEIEIKLVETVGETLRVKREEKKLSIIDVGTQLHLNREIILNIEKGEWHKLHGRAYARGYFVSYIKLLDLNEDEMMLEFNKEYSETSHDKPSLKNPHVANTDYFKWGRLFFVIALVLFIWCSYHLYKNPPELDSLLNMTNQTESGSKDVLTLK